VIFNSINVKRKVAMTGISVNARNPKNQGLRNISAVFNSRRAIGVRFRYDFSDGRVFRKLENCSNMMDSVVRRTGWTSQDGRSTQSISLAAYLL
jgi:hypothetical protein